VRTAAQFERALRFAANGDTRVTAALYDRLGVEQMLVGHFRAAVEAGEHALALWRQVGDRLREGDTLRNLSCSLQPLGRGPEAVASAEAAVTVLEPLGPVIELARAYSSLAASRMVNAEHQAAIDLAVRAQAIAEPLGALDVLSDVLNTQGCSLASIAGAGGEWTGHLRRALDVALSAGLDDQAGRAFVNLHSMFVAQRCFAEAEEYFTEGVAYCDERDIGAHGEFLRHDRMVALDRTGRWDEAAELSSSLLAGAGRSPAARLRPAHVLGLIRARRGEPGAWKHLDEASAAADASGEPQRIIPVRLARAEAHWLDGEQRLAAGEAELADDAAAGADNWDRGEIAVWLRRTGSDREARGELAEPYRRQLAGDWAGASRLWGDLGCPYEAALARYDAAEETALRQALTAFHDLGASAAARVTRQKMRRLGIRSIPAGPRTATRGHPLGLTRREHEVLSLLCAGHTNAEIAARLFISARTVDHHVSAVLTKLGAPTRGAAAAQAARLGLLGTADVTGS
jgi:DNA-binding CsgD family transcriptional regulator/tetratricopeptide (TPR) repeat protein